ncbi:uncharacterized protein MONBRDRAFT_27262 [Monosiga brevicollis MX1]|uniref:Uncharacterized protein n=1 Tax=Monosiga brevicollis TaxID=81824 RepID=A9V4S7_MONBE|nr:uncharacterized protein MONBRDRAFT_27262 [Monosiga brevicollis MX1]EDQ87506.1 predicted protein [Monosiga brevicollis MX1]|eukprot:XP_001747766.1 hypothetical protein [Monosiga brevicollis MX1]
MQHVEYTLTVALCETSAAGLLKAPLEPNSIPHVQLVTAHSLYLDLMPQSAGDVFTYPDLFFTIDDFDGIFDQFEVSPQQTFTLELCGTLGPRQTILINGSIPHHNESGGLVSEFVTHQGHKNTRETSWLHSAHQNLVFFRINAPEASTGFVEMALAPSASSDATPKGRAAAPSPWAGRAWGAYKQLLGLVKNSGGGPQDPAAAKRLSFQAFVTYISLPWHHVIDALTQAKPLEPKLFVMHQRRQSRNASLRPSPSKPAAKATASPALKAAASPGPPTATADQTAPGLPHPLAVVETEDWVQLHNAEST